MNACDKKKINERKPFWAEFGELVTYVIGYWIFIFFLQFLRIQFFPNYPRPFKTWFQRFRAFLRTGQVFYRDRKPILSYRTIFNRNCRTIHKRLFSFRTAFVRRNGRNNNYENAWNRSTANKIYHNISLTDYVFRVVFFFLLQTKRIII